jgi:hypothetical protein
LYFSGTQGDYVDGGFKQLLTSLSAIGADSLLTLPGVDEPTTAHDYMHRVLAVTKERAIPFEQAWSSAINRIQAPQGEDGFPDPEVSAIVAEERALLEEARPHWQANYEGRALTTRERAVCTVRAWHRLEGGTAGTGPKRAA